jgi:hypothetical protein
MESGGHELSHAAQRVLDHAEFARGLRLALVPAGRPGSVPTMWADDEWEPVYSRRWLRVVGIIVVASLVLPAIYVGLVRLGLL